VDSVLESAKPVLALWRPVTPLHQTAFGPKHSPFGAQPSIWVSPREALAVGDASYLQTLHGDPCFVAFVRYSNSTPRLKKEIGGWAAPGIGSLLLQQRLMAHAS